MQLSPEVSYTIVDVNGEAVIELGNGDRLTLTGVAPLAMGDWLVVV